MFAIKIPAAMVWGIRITMFEHHPVMGLYKEVDPIYGINDLKVIRSSKAVRIKDCAFGDKSLSN